MNYTVVYVLPSANLKAARASLPMWRSRGYVVAVLVAPSMNSDYIDLADFVLPAPEYHGYPWAINRLLNSGESEADLVIAGADDLFPDPHEPQEIATSFFHHFPDGFGVMQPIGDGHGCEDICGSPWLGRSFYHRINAGQGPFWPGYNHYFCDRELKLVSQRLGVLWQRPDLVHRHEHWSWTTGVRPAHMGSHSRKHAQDEALFWTRQDQQFPGHAPLANT